MNTLTDEVLGLSVCSSRRRQGRCLLFWPWRWRRTQRFGPQTEDGEMWRVRTVPGWRIRRDGHCFGGWPPTRGMVDERGWYV